MTLIRHELAQVVEQAALEAQAKNLLPPVALSPTNVERPQNPEHGDYATSLPLKLARAARMSPMAIAEILIRLLPPLSAVEKIAAAAPGFINFTLKDEWLRQQVETILADGDKYGKVALGQGERVQVEFVSANPTGPLHVGNGRGAVIGSTLANILSAAGYSVENEYYVNDTGNQIDVFNHSLYARYAQALGQAAELPEEGYGGQYLKELGQQIAAEVGDKYRLTGSRDEEKREELGKIGIDRILSSIRKDLEDLGVTFDVWFSEKSLYQGDQFAKVLALLRQGGYAAEKEGALWFVSTALGEDKDNVLVRSNGSPTYFASDAAYHHHKFLERGYQMVVDIWGADHQGHVSRVKAITGALGVDPERLKIIITQMVTLRRGAEVVRLSKRAGDIITLREVIDEVGADACRFFFLSRSADSQMDFDLELAKRQSNENPVYYVQYAHARIAGILRLAREHGTDWSKGDVSLLTSETEMVLIRKMLWLPELVEVAAVTLEPHSLPHYALDLATAFHAFYDRCRVISDDVPLTLARLKLVEAAQIALSMTLSLMGMSAPERM